MLVVESFQGRISKCGEWEHIIFFNQEYCGNNRIFFVDLTCISMNSVPRRALKYSTTVYSFTNNMISLKNYGDLVEPEEQEGITEYPITDKTYENLTKAAKASRRDLVYLKTEMDSLAEEESE